MPQQGPWEDFQTRRTTDAPPDGPWSDFQEKASTGQEIAAKARETLPKPSTLDKILSAGKGAVRHNVNLLEGVGSGALSTGFNVADLLNRGMGGDNFMENPTIQELTKSPDNPAGKFGRGVEQFGEFFLPGAVTSKLATAIKVGSKSPALTKVLSLLGRSGVEAGSAAGVTAAQGGDTEDMGIAALAGGGMTAVAPGISALGKMVANKMESAAIKAPLKEIKNGFDVKNIFKYDLGGTLSQTAMKTAAAMRTRVDELNGLLRGSPVEVNINKAIDEAEKELLGTMQGRAKNATFISEVKSAFKKFRADADQIAPEVIQPGVMDIGRLVQSQYPKSLKPPGMVDLVSANNFKRSVGMETNFEYGARSRESQGIELVANSLYSKVRKSIEDAAKTAGPRIKKVNRELGELIPIERAVTRRLPIDERQNMISLGTLVAGMHSPTRAAWYVASKSPYMANLLQKGSGARPELAGRGAAGIAEMIRTLGK